MFDSSKCEGLWRLEGVVEVGVVMTILVGECLGGKGRVGPRVLV